MTKAFISHSAKDRTIVEREIVDFLRSHGVETWYSKRDIRVGVTWNEEIVRGLENCEWFVIVMSPNSAESTWVRDELFWAVENRPEHIIPVMMDDCNPVRFHIRMARMQHVDFRRDPEEAREHLLAAFGIPLSMRRSSAEEKPPVRAETARRLQPEPVFSDPIVGIDLGTTYSMVTYLTREGRPVTLTTREGTLLTPSVVWFKDEDLHRAVVGGIADELVGPDVLNIVREVKRHMGHVSYSRPIQGRDLPPEVVSAVILRKLKQDAEARLGPLRRAVVTVPAYFDEQRRKATMDAGRMAGLDVVEILNEPTAATLAYAWEAGQLGLTGTDAQEHTIVVYDLGGGTFDVSVVRYRGNDLRVLATDGDVMLGGTDWTRRLVDLVAEAHIREYSEDPGEDRQESQRLALRCERAKQTLSVEDRAIVAFDYRSRSTRLEVSRQEFEEWTQDLIDRTQFTTQLAVKAAGLDYSDIETVVLVGGATRMPCVREMLREVFEKDAYAGLSPDQAVAHGAAIRAAMLQQANSPGQGTLGEVCRRISSVAMTNVVSHSLGIAATDPQTGHKRNATLIRRNSVIPCQARRRFKTAQANQKSARILVLEGDFPCVDDCTRVGECVISDLPPGLPFGSPVEVELVVDGNGRIHLQARDVVGDGRVQATLERPARYLSEEQITGWADFVCNIMEIE